MNWWKVLLTWPYLLLIYLKMGSMTKKVLKDPTIVPESKRYVWLKKKTKYIRWLYNVKIVSHDIENWPKHKGCVLVANHQSNFDFIILLSLNDYSQFAPLGFIAKEELKQNHIARRFIFLIDVLFIDRKDPRNALEVFKEAKELIRNPGRTMVIFPEGTRSHAQTMQEFKPGALKLAYQAYVPILPVSIINSYQIFDKKFKGRKTIHVVFHKPLEPQQFMQIASVNLAKQIQSKITQGIEKWDNNKEN
ncbi:hypothetical protein LT335_00011 [Spiroplasma sp. JKS002669]|uniref:lysophospholipid acyltransferase family protein n=1 Tax=Spiroplasma attinicola TaxID=2904537 RepID=UPI002022D552|nr:MULTISPECIES: lysophospholipid acyltransferase family protein [unclassified Spiroplasma]MCL6428472.1 hypothetical protein [Spiroplasma sp. JKS002669]MCL8209808.1 hypothetical protein [Spiroplasma sp. JKS002670]MCL8210766.1 hypothetical protein [Spiroplasma sp. JKS002671]